MRFGLIVISITCVLGLREAGATTWLVRQDGTGDFATIQTAIDASAPGDSIRIGAGRYLNYAYMSVGGNFDANVYVNVHVDDLTFIGEGIDATIIGPTTFHAEPPYGPIGFLVFSDVSLVRLEDLRVDHIYTGIYRWLGRLEIERCAFSGCRTGVAAWTDGGLAINASVFTGSTNKGIIAFNYSENTQITGCSFANFMSNVYFDSAQNANVSRCEFLSGTTGVVFSEGAYGSVSDCQFANLERKAVSIALNSTAVLERNQVIGGEMAVNVDGLSHLSGSNNRFDGQTYSTVGLHNSTIDFEYNQLLNPLLWAVRLPDISYTSPPTVDLNMMNNYWSSDDPAQIDEWIWDGNDNPNIHAVVVYQPIQLTTLVHDAPSAVEFEIGAFPNPFNPRTMVRYDLPHTGAVTLEAYDLRGRLVRSLLAAEQQGAGSHELSWDGRDDAGAALPSGTYLLRLEAGAEVRSLRVSLIR